MVVISLQVALQRKLKIENSITGQYLSGVMKIPVPQVRRTINMERCLEVVGASSFNLKI